MSQTSKPKPEPKVEPIELQAPDNVVPIPLPTEEDLATVRGWKSLPSQIREGHFIKFCGEGRLWAIQYALQITPDLIHTNSDEPLHRAVKLKQKQAVILLHAHNANLNSCKGLALRIAGSQRNKDLAMVLVDRGALIETALENTKEQETKDYLRRWFYPGKTIFDKQDDQRILRTSFLISDQNFITCHTEFNFRARKITTTLEKDNQITTPAIEYFKDQETPHEIDEARNALIKQGGKPGVYTIHQPATSQKSITRPK